MGVQNPNSTSYVHPDEPNLLNLHKALQYNQIGEPEIRVHVDGINLEGNVLVSNLKIDSGNITVWQGTSPWVTTGNANVTVIGNIAGITTLPAITIASLPEIEIKNDSGNAIPISANTSPNSPTNRLYVSMQTDAVIADSNYEMNVARGLADGHYPELKNGYCTSMTSGEKTIWSQGTLYPWSSWTTAQKLYIVSDSASDVGQTLYIEGLDASYNKISETVTTNGLTAVQTSNNYLRLNRGYLIGGNVNVGMISERLGSGSGTIVGSMYAGLSRNKQGTFTVPAGYTAYVLYGDVSSYKNGQGQIDGQVDMFVRTSATSPFMCVFAAVAGNGQYRNEFIVPLPVPQRSDIDVRYNPSGTCTVACNWQMILIPN
jgi:hypothetical protein